MPDTKITALTAIGANPIIPSTFPIPMVDLTDTSMAASGTTKKVTVNQILGAGGTATLASATITGDLTVDTSTLKVDSANNRVGIGTASPTVALDVVGAARFVAAAAGPKLSIENAGGSTRFKSTDTSSFYYSAYDHNFTNTDGSVNRYTIDNNGVSTWYVGGSTAMTLNATGLGVGVAPTQPLTVRSSVAAIGMFHSTNANGPYFIFQNSTGNFGDIGSELAITGGGSAGNLTLNSRSTSNLCFAVSDSVKMRIDSSGNVGIGVTPSAWQTGTPAVQLKYNSSIWSNSDNTIQINQNAYFDGSSWKYVNATSLQASNYFQYNGSHSWRTAPSGTAGNAITWTQAMTLDASGNLLVGKTASGAYTNGTQLFPAGTVATGHPNGTGSGAAYSIFAYDGVRTGDITQNGTTGVLYNTASDYRLKEQVQPLSGGLARVNALKPSVYKWKSDGSNGEGFLAHELAEVVPFAVSGEKDAVNEDGSIKSQGIDMSRVVPILVAAIQELTARVQTLETR